MIPILLNKEKPLSELVTSKTGGIGEITEAFDGVAVEEANGLKEISFKLPIDSPRYSELSVGSYIKAKADELHDFQIYEVYKITKPLNGIVTVRAQHISYILGKATVLPFTATGIVATVNNMTSNLVGTFPFTFETDISNTTSRFVLDIPMSFRGAIGGWRGSILDTFGGELDWDNLKVKLLAHRGRDNGARIEYGKNLTSLTQEESIAKVYDAVIGYAVVDEVTYVGDIQKIVSTNSPRTLNVDFSSEFDMDETPTKAKLNQLAMAYAQNNDMGKPFVNLKVSFELLAKTEEYKDVAILEQVNLFDTVYINFPKLGVDSKAKVIRTEYDFINEKPISVELGDAKTNLTGLFDEQIEQNSLEAARAVSTLDDAIANLTSIITNSLGLFYTKVEKAGGGFQYYLHNKPTLSQSKYQWTINAGGFALSDNYGQTWRAGIDSSGNAVFNSLAANIVRAMTIYGTTINGGTITGSVINGTTINFGNLNSKYITATTNSSNSGVQFKGNGNIDIASEGELFLRNYDSSNVMKNQLWMAQSNNFRNVQLSNRRIQDNNLANGLYLHADATDHHLDISNYDIDNSSQALANILSMNSLPNNNNNCSITQYDGNGGMVNQFNERYDKDTGDGTISLTAYKKNGDIYSSVARISINNDGRVLIQADNGLYVNGVRVGG